MQHIRYPLLYNHNVNAEIDWDNSVFDDEIEMKIRSNGSFLHRKTYSGFKNYLIIVIFYRIHIRIIKMKYEALQEYTSFESNRVRYIIAKNFELLAGIIRHPNGKIDNSYDNYPDSIIEIYKYYLY